MDQTKTTIEEVRQWVPGQRIVVWVESFDGPSSWRPMTVVQVDAPEGAPTAKLRVRDRMGQTSIVKLDAVAPWPQRRTYLAVGAGRWAKADTVTDAIATIRKLVARTDKFGVYLVTPHAIVSEIGSIHDCMEPLHVAGDNLHEAMTLDHLLNAVLPMVQKHAAQGDTEPRFAKDQCHEITKLLDMLT